jgi:DNA-binding transcriptional MerR regulator
MMRVDGMRAPKHVYTQTAANILGVNADTVRKYTNSGILPLVLDALGRRVFDIKTLERLAKQRARQ